MAIRKFWKTVTLGRLLVKAADEPTSECHKAQPSPAAAAAGPRVAIVEWLVQPPARQSFPLQEGALGAHRLFSRNVEGTGLDRQMAKHLVLADALGFQGRRHWQREPA